MTSLIRQNFVKRMAFATRILPFVFALLYFSACHRDGPNAGDEDNTPPAEVTRVNGTPGNAQVRLTRTDPADADFNKVTITGIPGNGTVEIGKGAQTAVVTGLTNGTEYNFTLKTVDVSGNESAGISAGPYTPEPSTASTV